MPEFAFALFLCCFGRFLPFFGRRRWARCLGNIPHYGVAMFHGGVSRAPRAVNQNTCDSSPFPSRDSLISVGSDVVIFELCLMPYLLSMSSVSAGR